MDYGHKAMLLRKLAHDEDRIVFDGTAKLNEINKSLIWADGKIYQLISGENVLKRSRDHFDFPNHCPFEKSSDLWGMTIYATCDVNYFTFEIA